MCDRSGSSGCFFTSRKEGRDPTPDIATSPRRQQQNAGLTNQRPKDPPPMVVQGDFRKVSGISNEIFRQIETVENDHDSATAAALEAVERRGEMVVRLLEPRHVGRQANEAVKRFLSLQVEWVLKGLLSINKQGLNIEHNKDNKHTVHLVEIVKRPGQTLGLYIREGNGMERTDGVFISRIALESAVYNSGCLKVGDEILAVNLVDVTRMSLDDVVIIMSIPRRLVLVTRQTKGGAASQLHQLQQSQHKPPPVVVIKKELREDDDRNGGGGGLLMDELADARAREERRRRAAANAVQGMPQREMSGSRSRLALGSLSRLGSHQDLHDGMVDPSVHNGLGLADLYYNSRPADRSGGGAGPGGGPGGGGMSSGWSYQPPPPVYSDQNKSGTPQHFQPYDRAYPKTLESLAEKVHSFYPGSTMNIHAQRRGSQQHCQTQTRTKLMPRSGSDQHLPRIEYQYAPPPRSAHTMLRSGMKSSMSHYGSRYSQQPGGYSAMTSSMTSGSSSRRHRPPLDYSSDTEATCASSPRSFYYRHALAHGAGTTATLSRLTATPLTRGGSLRSNSLPRDHRGRPMVPPSPATARHAQQAVRFDRESSARSTTGSLDQYDSDGALSAPELPLRRERGRLPSSPSVFTADEYCAWLQRTPSTSAIYERIRASRDALAQQRASRLTFSAENLNLLERTREHDQVYGGYRTPLTGTLDRQSFTTGRMSAASSLSGASRSQSLRRMRQLLELEARHNPSSAAAAALRTPTSVVPESTRGRIMEINPSEFLKYKMDKGPTTTTVAAAAAAAALGEPAGVSGLLWVHLLAGRGLRPSGGSSAATTPSTPSGPSAIGSSPLRDLYCVLECDRVHKARTVVRTGDLVFDWDETFELDLVANRELDFLIYSWDPQYRHKLCYKGSVHLATLLRQSPIHQLALKIEPRGTLYLRLRHTDPHQTFARRSSILSHPLLSRTGPKGLGGSGLLFGVDLETVVSRESLSGSVTGVISTALASQGAVPLIVRRCVEEVERRGLDIIGLYRLCGSATKKRILREAFERNARTVDLSPDNVPDINVITGVLKDYLRELPEPLFTKCLYQMMLDALTVCLPDDPEGNAKLMFSILDCLPKVNRATLIYLLDHLALVVSQSERNKMNPQNLAVCFGPIMMLITEEGRELDFNQTIGVLRYLLEIWPCKSVREVLSASLAAHQSPSQVLSSQKPPALPAKPAGLLTSLSRVQSSSPVVVSSPISEDSSASPSPPEEAEILRNLPTSVGNNMPLSGPGSSVSVTSSASMVGKRGPPPRVEPRRNAGKHQMPGSAQTLPRQVGAPQGSPLPLPPRGSATLQRKWSNGENGTTNGINRPLPNPPGRVGGGHVMEAIKNIEMQQHQQDAQREESGSGSAASSPRGSRNGHSPPSGSMGLTALSAQGTGERDASPAASDQIETPTSSTGTEDSRREGGEHGADGDEEASDEDDEDDRFRSGRGSNTSVVMRDVRQE